MTAGPVDHREGADARRDQALEAAMLEIAERGVDRTTMRGIAARAGMSPGHILYYFGSKDQLLLDVLRWSEEDLERRRRSALAKVADPWRWVQRFAGWYLPEGPRDPRWNLWAQLIARPPQQTDALRVVASMQDAWTRDLADLAAATVRWTPGPALAFAEHHCSLMDGLAIDVVLGLPGRSRRRAIRLAVTAMRAALEGAGDRSPGPG